MEFEISLEACSVSKVASKFIALEVSDNEDDYSSSVESLEKVSVDGTVFEGPMSSAVDLNGQCFTVSSGVEVAVCSATNSPYSDKKSRTEESKQSLTSNNSSNRKLWSILSFKTDKNSNTSKRMSILSSASSYQSYKTIRPLSSTMNKSSTDVSLRSSLKKKSLNDNYNNENTNVIGSDVSIKRSHFFSSSVLFNSYCNDTAELQESKLLKGTISPCIPLNRLYSNTSRASMRNSNYSQFTSNVDIDSNQDDLAYRSKWKFWKNGKNREKLSTKKMWHNTPSYPISLNNITRLKSSVKDLRKSVFSSLASNQELTRTDSTLKHRLSQNSLRPIESQNSLKTIASHSSIKKFRCDSSSGDSLQISQPIPDQASRDKIRNKLKHSTSLVSISTGDIYGNFIIAKTNEYDKAILNQLLNLCDVKKIQDYSTLPKCLEKISTNNVYINSEDKTIYKILLISTEDDLLLGKDLLLKEMQLQCLLSGTPGFVKLRSCAVYHKPNEGIRYLVLHMKNHGKPLSKTKNLTQSQVEDILTQCVCALYVAETKFQFEHRYLTLDHVLLDKQGNVTLCDYRLSRASQGTTCFFTRLDNPMFFQFHKEYSYVLQWMRNQMNPRNWHLYHPKTNIYWLHYLITWLLANCQDNSTNRLKIEMLQAKLDPMRRRKLWRRGEPVLENCGDLLSQL